MKEPFAACNPSVCFIFFAEALLLSVFLTNPCFLALDAAASTLYMLLLRRSGGLRFLMSILGFSALLAALNPLFNTSGSTVLFTYFSRPYTLEALLYGVTAGGMFFSVMMWASCWQQTMDSDKMLYLFSGLAPAASLMLSMVFQMVPALRRKAETITAVQKGIGCTGTGNTRQKLRNSVGRLSALTSWALEGSLTTADSMKSRGYGTGRRTSFARYTFRAADCGALVFFGACFLLAAVSFSPRYQWSCSGTAFWLAFGGSAALLLFPSFLHIKEDILWNYFRSKILAFPIQRHRKRHCTK